LRLFAAPELAIQFVTAKIPAVDAPLHDREVRLRLRGGAVWPADGHFGIVMSGALRLLPFGSAGEEESADRARTSRIAAELSAGIELRL
jgi:hypothetical protein